MMRVRYIRFICLTLEKAVFACLENDDGYDELEDDFLFQANEGKPAIIEEEFDNKGVIIVKDEFEERLKEVREAMQ